MINNPNLTCPNCHHMDYVQKVSAIVNAGISSGTYMGYSDGIGYTSNDPIRMDERIIVTKNSQTALSQFLSPPTRPIYARFWQIIFSNEQTAIAIIILFTGGLIGFYLTYIMGDFGFFGWMFIICWGLLALLFFGLYASVRSNHAAFPQENARWQRAMHKWQHLYYCHRCDIAFIPDQSLLIHPSRVKDFLYD